MAIQGTSYITAEDVASIQSDPNIGTGTDAFAKITDMILTNNCGEHNVEDLIAYLMMNGIDLSAVLDPDNAAVAYLFTDADVQGMLQESYCINSEFAPLIEDINIYRAHLGLSTDIGNQAAMINAMNAQNVSLTDEQSENLITIGLENSGLAASYGLMTNMMDMTEDYVDSAADWYDDWANSMDDNQSELESIDPDDSTQASIDMAKINNRTSQLTSMLEAKKAMDKAWFDALATATEMFSNEQKSGQSVNETILRNMV